jgi:hypothetical protein
VLSELRRLGLNVESSEPKAELALGARIEELECQRFGAAMFGSSFLLVPAPPPPQSVQRREPLFSSLTLQLTGRY